MIGKPKPVKQKRGRKRRPKSERSLLESRLDLLVSTIVILRDGRCVTCGTADGLTCSHFVARGKSLLRWDLHNCNCQCATDNGKHNRWKEAYELYMLDHYGAAELRRIVEAGCVNAYKWAIVDLRSLEQSLSAEAERLILLQTDTVRVEWARKRLAC